MEGAFTAVGKIARGLVEVDAAGTVTVADGRVTLADSTGRTIATAPASGVSARLPLWGRGEGVCLRVAGTTYIVRLGKLTSAMLATATSPVTTGTTVGRLASRALLKALESARGSR